MLSRSPPEKEVTHSDGSGKWAVLWKRGAVEKRGVLEDEHGVQKVDI
jgi:hypothetical protein